MFKKRIALFFLIGVLAGTPILAGCTSESAALMQEYKERGIAQMETGDYAGAASSFQTALDQSIGQIRAEEIDLCYYRALALFLAGETEASIEAYTALVDYDSDNWEVYYLRGNVYLQDGQEEAALADYENAASLHADDPELCVHIYANLCNAGLETQAQSYRDTALAMNPSGASDYYYLGEIYYLSEDYENAVFYLTTAREMGYEEAILLLATLYDERGDSESAQKMFSAYMDLHPDDPLALGKLGEMALSDGEYEKAIDYLTRAEETAEEEDLSSIVKNLVAAYEYSGDFTRAFQTAEEYLAQHSDAELERESVFLETRVKEEDGSDTDSSESEAVSGDMAADAAAEEESVEAVADAAAGEENGEPSTDAAVGEENGVAVDAEEEN